MGTDNFVFLEVIEWFDETGNELVHRIPENGSGEIKFGAQLTIRESQAGVLFYKGKACDAFGPGRHTLKTGNIPVLTKLLAVPWGMTSPLRAEVYFTNLKRAVRHPPETASERLCPLWSCVEEPLYHIYHTTARGTKGD